MDAFLTGLGIGIGFWVVFIPCMALLLVRDWVFADPEKITGSDIRSTWESQIGLLQTIAEHAEVIQSRMEHESPEDWDEATDAE